jgi:hypothetical protein
MARPLSPSPGSPPPDGCPAPPRRHSGFPRGCVNSSQRVCVLTVRAAAFPGSLPGSRPPIVCRCCALQSVCIRNHLRAPGAEARERSMSSFGQSDRVLPQLFERSADTSRRSRMDRGKVSHSRSSCAIGEPHSSCMGCASPASHMSAGRYRSRRALPRFMPARLTRATLRGPLGSAETADREKGLPIEPSGEPSRDASRASRGANPSLQQRRHDRCSGDAKTLFAATTRQMRVGQIS